MANKYDLVIVAYEGRDTAEKVWETVLELKKDKEIDIKDGAIIVKDDKGKVKLSQKKDMTVGKGLIGGGAVGLIIGVAVGGPIAVAALGASLGGLLGDGLGQEDSAIALLIKKANWPAVKERTDQFNGKTLISNLTDDTLEALEKLAEHDAVAQAVTDEVVEQE